MPRAGQIKYPFSLRTLEERHTLEQSYLAIFNKELNRATVILADTEREKTADDLFKLERTLQWANKNIESCKHRINELKAGISVLKTIVYSEEECKNAPKEE